MSSTLRWTLLIWRYLAALMLVPFAVAMLGALVLGAPGPRTWLLLALVWPACVVLATLFLGGRRIARDLALAGAILGLVAVLLPRILSLPILLAPVAVLLLIAGALGLWVVLGQVFQREFLPRKRRKLAAVTCTALPAERTMATLRLAPGLDTPLHRCGAERADGWFPVERKMAHLRHDDTPGTGSGPWFLTGHLAAFLPALFPAQRPRDRVAVTEYARIVEDNLFDQTVAFSDGDGVSLSLLRICVTRRRRGCVVRETGWTNRLGLFDWICTRLQNHGLWSLAARLDHIGGAPAQYAPTDVRALTPSAPALRDKRADAAQIGQSIAAKLEERLRPVYHRSLAIADMLRARQWR